MKSKVVAIKKCIECPNSYYRYGIEGNVNTGVPWCSLIDTELTERQTKIHDKCTLPNSESPSTPVAGREQLIENIKVKIRSNGDTLIGRTRKGAYADCIMMIKDASHPVSKPTDEDIEKESLKRFTSNMGHINGEKHCGFIKGAKAYRDGKIPISQPNNEKK